MLSRAVTPSHLWARLGQDRPADRLRGGFCSAEVRDHDAITRRSLIPTSATITRPFRDAETNRSSIRKRDVVPETDATHAHRAVPSAETGRDDEADPVH